MEVREERSMAGDLLYQPLRYVYSLNHCIFRLINSAHKMGLYALHSQKLIDIFPYSDMFGMNIVS